MPKNSRAGLWPQASSPLPPAEEKELLRLLRVRFTDQLAAQQLPPQLATDLPRLYLPLAAWLNQQRPAATPLLVGLNGAQGSGKSTLCTLLKSIMETAFSCRTLIISIDDLYLPAAARQDLARRIHPLLVTRGVPGTHDVPLGIKLLKQLKQSEPEPELEIPRFSKADDDRRPRRDWTRLNSPIDLILFEGWCVGATPQTEAELLRPVNSLEADEDPEGDWRRYVNNQLCGPYQELFALIDLQLMLKIPDWRLVYLWRKRQEQQLADGNSGRGVMDEATLQRFIMHYQRLTEHQLRTLPRSADLVLDLDPQQRVAAVKLR